MEYDWDKKAECERQLAGLQKEAYVNKHRVTYRIIELDGEMQYEGKELYDRRKRLGVERVIISQGKMYDDIPIHVQRDL